MSEYEMNLLEDWASEELSEEELDALAGGNFTNGSNGTNGTNGTSGGMFLTLDPSAVATRISSSYTRYTIPTGSSALFP